MSRKPTTCPDCDVHALDGLNRRDFLKTTGAAAAMTAGISSGALADNIDNHVSETSVKALYDTLSADQRSQVCFNWDFEHPNRGLLRTRISNNWHITKPTINSDFFSNEQRGLIREVFEGIYNPEWIDQIDKQLKDDAGGYGNRQNIAIFGQPGSDHFEFVMTGRHMTIRCDGNTTEHVAFGGPIFYGHAASGFNEKPGHPGNVFWQQALEANKVYEMLDGKQRQLAEVSKTPREQAVAFAGTGGTFPGIPVAELSSDQQELVQNVLKKLIEPYRQNDQDEVQTCLKNQGGLEKCSLAFYTDRDLGDDGVWDNWRLEGPSFVWYFRGAPHVHVWVNVANDASVALNA